MKQLAAGIILLFMFSLTFSQNSTFLDLPDKIYLTTTSEFSIFYTNLIPLTTPENYNFTAEGAVGSSDSIRYILDSLSVGEYDLSISIFDSLNVFLEKDSCQIIVTDDDICAEDTLRILMIGDSYTEFGIYENFVKDMYVAASSDTLIKFLGTNYNWWPQYYAIERGIYHEGYSGKNWNFFANDINGPFVFDETGNMNFQRYIDEKINGEQPDIVTVFLGVNDVGRCDDSSIESIDAYIDDIFSETKMTKVINSIVNVLPDKKIGIALTPPLNAREYTYVYADSTILGFEGRKKVHHRLCQRYEDYFKELNNPNITVIPSNVCIDILLGFGDTDSIHPNSYGYEQIANSIYGWMKYQIEQWSLIPQDLVISCDGTQTTLSWQEVAGADIYTIYRSTDPYSTFEEIGTSTEPDFTDPDISEGNKYFYKVTSQAYPNKNIH